MHIDVAVEDDGVLADRAREQLIPRQHAAGMSAEEVEQAQLRRRERDRLAADQDLVARAIDDEALPLEP